VNQLIASFGEKNWEFFTFFIGS